jgi:hypothetical protein
MRTTIMIFLASIVAVALAACTVMMDEGSAATLDQTYETDEQALSLSSDGPVTEAAKDCSVSIQCANGTTRSCNGTSGSCSASGSGNGSVTCNGTTSSCPTSTCGSDGVCNESCGFDPDCFCSINRSCTTHAQCGLDGYCQNNRCVCL